MSESHKLKIKSANLRKRLESEPDNKELKGKLKEAESQLRAMTKTA